MWLSAVRRWSRMVGQPVGSDNGSLSGRGLLTDQRGPVQIRLHRRKPWHLNGRSSDRESIYVQFACDGKRLER